VTISYYFFSVLNEELIKIKNHVGGFLTFNSFLSTSLDEAVGHMFAETILQNSELVPVLFCIVIPSGIRSFPFASVDNISAHKSEEEYLFSCPTVFRIVEVREQADGIWNINLEMTNADDPQLNRLTEHFRENEVDITGMERLVKCLVQMDELDKFHYYKNLIREKIIGGLEPIILQADNLLREQSRINNNKEISLEHAKTTLEFCLNHLPNDHYLLSDAYSNVARVLRNEENFDLALRHYEHSLDIKLKQSCPSYENIVTKYYFIGDIFTEKGDFNKAHESYDKAFEVCSNHLPPTHPRLASVHGFVGRTYMKSKDYSAALHHFKESLQICQKSLIPNHRNLGASYLALAHAYSMLHNSDEAITHGRRAVEIYSLVGDPLFIRSSEQALEFFLLEAQRIKKKITIEDWFYLFSNY
jgi:tetratricopeptide (TPR) repeat protein